MNAIKTTKKTWIKPKIKKRVDKNKKKTKTNKQRTTNDEKKILHPVINDL